MHLSSEIQILRLWGPSEIHRSLGGSPDSGLMYRLNPSHRPCVHHCNGQKKRHEKTIIYKILHIKPTFVQHELHNKQEVN